MEKAPNIMNKAPNIMVLKSNIMEKASNVMVFEPKIISFAPPFHVKSIEYTAGGTECNKIYTIYNRIKYYKTVLTFHTDRQIYKKTKRQMEQ